MCVPILRSIGTKLTKLENMQKSCFIWFIWRHVTQKRYVMRHGDYVMAQIVVLVFSLTLTFVLLFVTRTAHDVLEYPCEVSLESVQ